MNFIQHSLLLFVLFITSPYILFAHEHLNNSFVHNDIINKNNYYIAKELWEDGGFKYLHIIPKKTAIIKITELKEVRK